MKTTSVDLEKVSGYLKSQVGWVPLDQVRKAIPSKHADSRKVEAMRHLGLLERDGENVKLTDVGRDYAASPDDRPEIIGNSLRSDKLYNATLEWMHFREKLQPTKTDIANYWHDDHSALTGGAVGDALTDPAVFFMRMVGTAGLGKFVAAGAGRETHLKMDEAALAEFATGEAPQPQEEGGDGHPPDDPPPAEPPTPPPPATVNAGLNVNVEIHIAADAKPATIEEIFKNMRKYLVDGPDATSDGD